MKDEKISGAGVVLVTLASFVFWSAFWSIVGIAGLPAWLYIVLVAVSVVLTFFGLAAWAAPEE